MVKTVLETKDESGIMKVGAAKEYERRGINTVKSPFTVMYGEWGVQFNLLVA
jgi:hypothetical protein